ncbi:universal stress protein [Lacisediminihabitans profunda]|uniref:Universal stress protein n=1 Tax=Lacisediminihabitans profunda TaxID=2594790 RepID=A0A5C8UNT1_9MICO|nr:universal stress protein [Lacisediminihabitans profunda]TXN28967.1 universal stress protein [Lacisediminihabitans profunda]
MERTILAGIDGSSPSRSALTWTMRRAAATGAGVLLVHVVDDEWGMIGTLALEEIHRSARELVEAESEFARSLEPTVPVTSEVLRGDPMVELASASARSELVVVGTHKTGFLHGRAFGSRSLQLAASAQAPVAIIPESSVRNRRGIVAGVDDSTAGWAAVRFAAAEAERTGQDLTLVRSWRLPQLRLDPDDRTLQHEKLVHAAVEQMMADAVSLAKEHCVTVSVKSRTMRRTPAEALIEASTSARLLVIGSSRRHGLAQRALGPVSHDVLLNLAGPTLVVHGDQDADHLEREEARDEGARDLRVDVR